MKTKESIVIALVGAVAAAGLAGTAAGGGQRAPLAVPFEQTLDYQWLRKPVLDQRQLDDMDDLGPWTLTGKGEMALATDPVEHGTHSLRISTRTRTPEDVSPPDAPAQFRLSCNSRAPSRAKTGAAITG